MFLKMHSQSKCSKSFQFFFKISNFDEILPKKLRLPLGTSFKMQSRTSWDNFDFLSGILEGNPSFLPHFTFNLNFLFLLRHFSNLSCLNMLIAFLSTCSVFFQRPHCPSRCSSWSFPTSLLYNNSNILLARLYALIVLFGAQCHPYHASQSPPLPTKKNPVAFPMPLSSLPVLPLILLHARHHPCHPSHLLSSPLFLIAWKKNEFLFFPKALPSLLVLSVVLPKASCSPPCPDASLSSFQLSLVGQKAISAATITPQHPCCPHGSCVMEQPQKKTKSQTPWTHSKLLFFTQDILKVTKPGNPAKNIEYEFCFIVQTKVKFTCWQCSSLQATLYS